jgi:3',5'-cyclic AMP phosphodiesterase CpdA
VTVIVQLSDPHFGAERPAVVEALVDWVRARAPDLLVVSGDVTQRARRSQFAAARAFVDRLNVAHTLVIPGNHDVPLFDPVARALRPYANFRRAFGDALEPCHESDRLLVLAVRTTRRWRHIDGEVSDAQVERVARRLERSDDAQLRVVVVHQPVAVTRPEDAHDLLHGHERALRRWAGAGADLVMGGHIHLPYVLAVHERMAGLARPIWAVQAGTAVSRRVRRGAPNSVNLVRWPVQAAGRRCEVERWDCADAARGFERVDVATLELADREAAPLGHDGG